MDPGLRDRDRPARRVTAAASGPVTITGSPVSVSTPLEVLVSAQRRVTLADVARRAEVSTTAVSLVLSGRGRELRISQSVEDRIRKAAAELEYRRNIVSVGLRTGTTRTIGFVSDSVATSRLAGDMIKGALEAARERGAMLFIGETEDERDLTRGLLDAMHDRQVDGVVFASMFTRRVTVPKALTASPAVLLNALPRRANRIPCVVPDEVEGGRAAARLLVESGHRDGIHFVGAGPRPQDAPPEALAGRERVTGVLEVFRAAGIRIAGGHVCADWQPEHGYAATRRLLDEHRPNALICMNDRLALGAYQALEDAGLRIPDQVSVVSFDDHPVAAWIRPALTTIALPHYELGRVAVDLLFGEIDRRRRGVEPDSTVYRVPMPVRVRDSLAAPAV